MDILYLYMLYDKDSDGVKVGISNNPKNRAEVLPQNIDYDKSICVIGKAKHIKKAEKGVHNTFYQVNINHNNSFDGHTEWFEGTSSERIREYIEHFFLLTDWTLIKEVFNIEQKEKEFKKKNSPIKKYVYSTVVEFNNEEEDFVFYSMESTSIYSFFRWESFKNIWIWYYIRKSSVYVMELDKSIRTLKRENIKQIRGIKKVIYQEAV